MKILLIATLLLSPTALLGLSQQPTSSAPEDPYRQFDFWVGSWRCETQDGKAAGTNVITLECGDKVLHENWTGTGGGVGKSLNIYDAKQKTWHQTWVDQSGTLLQLDGNLDTDGNMVLRGTRPGKDGVTVKHQIKWSPQGEQVRQTWTYSTDDGETWTTAADLNYIRVVEDQPESKDKG
jgi:hypothetical protein